MKSRLVIRLLLFVASGALFGQLVQSDHVKWYRLGRQAFLSYQELRFDHYMANPGTGINYVIMMAIFALGLGALYEGIAYVGDKLITPLFRERAPRPRNI
jgi:hypothetical protein